MIDAALTQERQDWLASMLDDLVGRVVDDLPRLHEILADRAGAEWVTNAKPVRGPNFMLRVSIDRGDKPETVDG